MSQNSTIATGDALPGESLPLSAHHRRELFIESAIAVDVAHARGYATVERPAAAMRDEFGRTTREQLAALGFPSWSIREDYYFPGLHIPQYTPRGLRYAGQWKPFRPVANRDGKPMKYASARGPARIDVHPFWTADRGGMQLPAIQDPSVRLWITEGVKKADALTSRGECTIALAGVFNWRAAAGSLGDWEDVRLKGREVVLCFDADTISKPAVANAMQRLGKWLKYKGVLKVWYLTVPPGVNGKATKGVDDYFAAGGTLIELERAFETKAPEVTSTEDRFTDARLAETLVEEVLDGRFIWAAGLDWLRFNGQRWEEVHEVTVIEAVRQWAVDHFAEAAAKYKLDDKAAGGEVDGWKAVMSKNRAAAVLSLTRGIVERKAEEFDADPDILNTPGGMVHLPTKTVFPHDPDALCTKITSGSYVVDFTHPDWERALEVLPKETMLWMQTRVGQGATGHTTADGVVPILKGGGENGKGLLFTDGLLPALGNYAAVASPKLFASSKNEHSTERADLRGQRVVIAEELTEGRAIDVTSLKQIADVGEIKARRTHKDNMQFTASHSLFATTNYDPVIVETDHGTWRRLCMVEFPYTYVKPGEPITNHETERRGDPTLKARIKANKSGQHDAAVTWVVEGAWRWYKNVEDIERAVEEGREPPASVLLPPPAVAERTHRWRVTADRVLGYWTDRLIGDSTAFVLATELVEDFNGWLTEGGHSAWSKETFGPRFRDHTETKRQRVVFMPRRRTASIAAHVMRRPGMIIETPLKAQADVYQGLRWRTEADEG